MKERRSGSRDVKIHDCKTHGVAVCGDLLGEIRSGVVEQCEIMDNGADGVLIGAEREER